MDVVIHHLYVSPGHNYFGHHGRPAGQHAAVNVDVARCRAGRGIEGDRFFGYRPDYKGQVTFFAWETCEAAKARFGVADLVPSAFRRNVIISGVALPALIGTRFRLGDVEFAGVEESRPCYWMDQAVAPGAEAWLRGNGGLRARVLTDGELRVGPQALTVQASDALLPGFTAHSLVGR